MSYYTVEDLGKGWRKHTLGENRYYISYYLGDKKIIHLWDYDGLYIAEVYSLNHSESNNNFIKDKELEVVKFKSLLKAKEIGWDITFI